MSALFFRVLKNFLRNTKKTGSDRMSYIFSPDLPEYFPVAAIPVFHQGIIRVVVGFTGRIGKPVGG